MRSAPEPQPLAPRDRSFFSRGLCFSVVGGGGQPISLRPSVTAPLRLGVPRVSGGPSLRLQSLEGGSRPGSREQGYSLENGRTLGALRGRLPLSGLRSLSGSSSGLALAMSPGPGHSGGALAAAPRSLPQPPQPVVLARGSPRHGLPGGRCGGQTGQEAE